MAVLSEKQIEELVALFDVWWNGEQSYRDYLTEWNDKQPTQQHASSDKPPNSSIGVSEITLRDYFAVEASDVDVDKFMPKTVGDWDKMHKEDGEARTRQRARYLHADAMLKARGRV